MRTILYYVVFSITLLIPFCITGQTLPNLPFQLEPCTSCTDTYPAYQAAFQIGGSNITEDFGRRECCDNKWHRGLDVNGDPAVSADKGFHIKSITAGTIARIYSGDYKVIAITGTNNQNFGYGHIFQDDVAPYRLGDMVIAKLTSNVNGGDQYNAIIYDPSIASNAYCLTDAPLTGGAGDANFYMTYTRKDGTVLTFTTTGVNQLKNSVLQGDKIAPLGGSGGFLGKEHVHLYSFINTPESVTTFQIPDNLKNPLSSLNYRQPATLTQSLEITRGDATPVGGTGPFYGNINLKAKVLFNAQQYPSGVGRYSTTSPIFDLNRVELNIKEDNAIAIYSPLKGAHFESIMDFGGSWGGSRYPSDNNPVGNTVGGDGGAGVDISQNKLTTTPLTSAGYGDYRKTGIRSIAYSTYTSADAYDEFFFNEYNTRIHENDNFGKATAQLANRSYDARYPDGRYVIKVKTKTIKNVIFESPATTITIDNFQPFIEKVEAILNYNDLIVRKTAYLREWQFNDFNSSQTLLPAQTPNDIFEGQNFTIQVTTSEAIPALNISIPTLGINNIPMEASIGNAKWFYPVPGAGTVTGNHPISFSSGPDYNGNALVSFPERIPTRNDAGTWVNSSATGMDRNHSIFIEPGDCDNTGGKVLGSCDLIADFSHTISSSNPLTVSFTDASVPPGSITSRSWNFGDPTSGSQNTSTLQNPTHTFSSNGAYTVTLTIGDGTTTDTHNKLITVDNTPGTVSFNASKTIGNVPLTVDLSGVTNLLNASSWEWIITPTTNQTFSPSKYAQNTTVTFSQIGTYSVKVRVSNGTTSYLSSAQTIQVNSASDPIPQFSWSGQTYAYSPILFKDESFLQQGCNTGTSEWTVTDPIGYQSIQTTSTGGPFSYYPTEVGLYSVTLCVTDNCGKKVCNTKTINVLLKTNTIQPDFTASKLFINKGETIEFKDITSDPGNKLKQWGWWFKHVPGTEWGHCEEPYCYERGDSYTGVIKYTYNTPGTYQVRLMAHENIGYPGLSKTVTIQVEDNVLNALQNPNLGGYLISISGDYAATYTATKILVSKRTGSVWNEIAQLSGSNMFSGSRLAMSENTIALKTYRGISIWERPSTGWTSQPMETQIFLTPENDSNTGRPEKDMDMSDNRIVSKIETVTAGQSYVETYKKNSGVWVAESDRLDIGYGNNAITDIALDQGTLIVRQIDYDKVNYNRIRIYNRTQNLSGPNSWTHQADLSRQDYYFATGFDIYNNVIVAVNETRGVYPPSPQEAYVYQKPQSSWQSNASPTAVLKTETLQSATSYFNRAVIQGDKILLNIMNRVFLYNKPLDGWKNMTETVRLQKSNLTQWEWVFYDFDINGNYAAVIDNRSTNLFEIEPEFCDDPETFGSFNLAYGKSMANQKGYLTIGGGGLSVIGLGAKANFRGTKITVKPGFKARTGSVVSITATTCEDF